MSMRRSYCFASFIGPVLLITLVSATATAIAGDQDSVEPVMMSIYVDNDALTSRAKDEDYTGGAAVTYSGINATRHPFSLDKPLAWTNRISRIEKAMGLRGKHTDQVWHSCEVGLAAFTPTDIELASPIRDDRPYSSLIYVANTRQSVDVDRRVSVITTLSLGALGLSAAGNIQNGIHAVIGSSRAEGWDNQISRGGEPTVKYAFTRQRHLDTGSPHIHAAISAGASLGYITEGILGVSVRAGIIRTPWWSFNVHNSNYGEKSNITLPTSKALDEFYVVGGANIKARAYNVFLQGQFRDSEVTWSASELEPILYEAWLGVACEFGSGIRLSYLLRHQSSEFKAGQADRDFTYGELVASYKF